MYISPLHEYRSVYHCQKFEVSFPALSAKLGRTYMYMYSVRMCTGQQVLGVGTTCKLLQQIDTQGKDTSSTHSMCGKVELHSCHSLSTVHH